MSHLFGLLAFLLFQAEAAVVSCTCDTPGGDASQNQITCSDTTTTDCGAGNWCYATTPFPKSSLEYGCRAAATPYYNTTCEILMKDALSTVYLNGIEYNLVDDRMNFTTIDGVGYKLAIHGNSSHPAPLCKQAGLAVRCAGSDPAWDGFSSNIEGWYAFSSASSTGSPSTWEEIGGDTTGFEAPCESDALMDLTTLGLPIQKKIWASQGDQYAWFVATRPDVTASPTATVSPSAAPSSFVSLPCGTSDTGAAGPWLQTISTCSDACCCEEQCYITTGCEAWQFMTSGADANECYLKSTWDLGSKIGAIGGRKPHPLSMADYVFEGGYWAEMYEYDTNSCSDSTRLVRKSYYRRDVCNVDPHDHDKSFKVTATALIFYSGDTCSTLIRQSSFSANNCVVYETWRRFKMVDWDVHSIDDSINSFLRKVYVSGKKFEACNGPYHIEHWASTDCLENRDNPGFWRKEICLNNIQRKGQDYVDSSCTTAKGNENTIVSLLGRCSQEGDQNIHYWDFGCGFQHQEHQAPHEREMLYHGEALDCVVHPHREKTCLQ